MKIEPWVVPEVRYFEALEKFYGVPRRPRYVALSAAIAVRKTLPAHPVKSKPASRKSGDGHGDVPAGTMPGVEFGYGQSWLEVAKSLVAATSSSRFTDPKPRKAAVSSGGDESDCTLSLVLCREQPGRRSVRGARRAWDDGGAHRAVRRARRRTGFVGRSRIRSRACEQRAVSDRVERNLEAPARGRSLSRAARERTRKPPLLRVARNRRSR